MDKDTGLPSTQHFAFSEAGYHLMESSRSSVINRYNSVMMDAMIKLVNNKPNDFFFLHESDLSYILKDFFKFSCSVCWTLWFTPTFPVLG